MEVFLLGLGMSLLIGVTLGAIVLYSKMQEGRVARYPKSDSPSSAQDGPPTAAQPAPPSLIDRSAARIMSRLATVWESSEASSEQVAPVAQEGVQGLANGRNPDNDELAAQPFAQPTIPEEARDIIIFWDRVGQVERVVAAGKIGQVEAIELIFNCKRNGRADSVYGKARAAIMARSESTYRANQDRLVELQAATNE